MSRGSSSTDEETPRKGRDSAPTQESQTEGAVGCRKRARSGIWEHSSEHVNVGADGRIVRCKHWTKSFINSQGTSSLRRHYNSSHDTPSTSQTTLTTGRRIAELMYFRREPSGKLINSFLPLYLMLPCHLHQSKTSNSLSSSNLPAASEQFTFKANATAKDCCRFVLFAYNSSLRSQARAWLRVR